MSFFIASLADFNPCIPSPCGPYSTCKEINGHGVCSCQEGYTGMPPTCRPECVISTDCPQHQACIRQKCKDPCPGTCGVNARCQTINHNPICTCKAGFTGDPFVSCQLDKSKGLRSKYKKSQYRVFYCYNSIYYNKLLMFIAKTIFFIKTETICKLLLYSVTVFLLNYSFISIFLHFMCFCS